MFSASNFYNTDVLKRFHARTFLLQGADCRHLAAELIDAARPGVVVVDRALAQDAFAASLAPGAPRVVVEGEPKTDGVDAALKRLATAPEWIVAIGGGSTIDTAKAVCAHGLFGAYRRVGYGDLRNAGDRPGLRPARLIAIPTTAGSGSETSRYFLVSDAATGEKLVSRSWAIAPEIALLDPHFLREAPPAVLVAGAFDAFAHHWESLICRHERSPIVDALSLEGIALIVGSLDAARRDRTPSALEGLQRASALAGMAISNVRSGVLHTAGEALAAYADLPHPLTLMVFFRETLASYRAAVAATEARVLDRLDDPRLRSLDDLVAFWSARFDEAGLSARIREALSRARIDRRALVERVLADQVLVTKENPQPLDRPAVEALVNRALDAAGAIS